MPYDHDDKAVSMNDALDAWQPLAVALLEGTAKRYNAVVTYKQLGEFVRTESGIQHDGLLPNWIGNVLGRVISHCVTHGLPHLSSLCVTAEGTVGDGYRAVIEAERRSGGGLPDDAQTLDELDDHAARTRLDCYRYFGAELPAGGGEPTLTPQVKSARDAKRAKARLEAPPKICPTCREVLPATGQCDNCN